MAAASSNGLGPAGDAIQPYRTLTTRTRRRAAVVYFVMAIGAAIVVAQMELPAMWFTLVAVIASLGVIQFVAGWKMSVTDMGAIAIARDATSFEVGHGSASLGFRGVLAKPVWQVYAYAAGPAPDHQGIVTVDAMSGDVLGVYEEEVEPI